MVVTIMCVLVSVDAFVGRGYGVVCNDGGNHSDAV